MGLSDEKVVSLESRRKKKTDKNKAQAEFDENVRMYINDTYAHISKYLTSNIEISKDKFPDSSSSVTANVFGAVSALLMDDYFDHVPEEVRDIARKQFLDFVQHVREERAKNG